MAEALPLRLRFFRWRRHWLRDPVLAAINFSLLGLVRALPTDRGSALGALAGRFNGRYRYPVIRERIKGGFQALRGGSAAEGEALVDRLFANTGRTMLEFAILDRLWREGRISALGVEHLREAEAAGRPMVGACLHLGNWEVLGPTLIGLGFQFHAVYGPPRSRFEHKIAVTARRRYGASLLHPGIGATRAALRVLREERGILGIYVDEERQGYVNAPLFGRKPAPRANLVTAVRLAMASDAVLIPCYVERLDGARFRTTFMPPVELAPGRDALDENIQRLDRAITPPVLAHLDQWYSMMDYWRPERF